jgi:NAD(P)H-flavin reductase
MALYSGPHGLSEPVDDYENVLLVASDSGIPAVIPYARKLNMDITHVHRVFAEYILSGKLKIAKSLRITKNH